MEYTIKCPCCDSANLVKNGISPSHKQNRLCKDCWHQFLENLHDHFITEYEKSWLIIHVESRQIMAMYCGDRTTRSARKLWNNLPKFIRNNGHFYTDYCKAYLSVIPKFQHKAVGKDSGLKNNIKGFNCIIRQRKARLVRETLSFSRKFANHVGAIKYFICHHNLTVNSTYT